MILIDTQTTVWLAELPHLLSRPARDAIREERRMDGLAVADKTLWELALMISRGRLAVKVSMQDFLQSIEENFVVLPINAAIAQRAVSFTDRYPKDPTDRIIGATAIVHGLRLVTSDGLIRDSGEVDCVW